MSRFDYFVIFAEMRTGSNLLESNLNSFEEITCYGEAFNPHFIGYPNRSDILGVSETERNKNPKKLLNKIKSAPGLNGFRFFNDHDPRVLDICLEDPRCAKIILTRNPIESYVSRKIAVATGQWKLTQAKHAKRQTVVFDEDEFQSHLATLQSFQIHLHKKLQTNGQTAFYVNYEDANELDVINGIAKFLCLEEQLDTLEQRLKKQNPEPLSSKVENFEEMAASLASIDRFNLNKTPNFEPRRGPVVPTYFAPPESALLFMPIRSGPEEIIQEWLAKLDDVGIDKLKSGFTQNTLRDWKKQNTGHRSFTVIRHPVARAHTAFCDKILSEGKHSYHVIRRYLIRDFGMSIPEDGINAPLETKEHREAFTAFLKFLKANLGGQTAIRVDPHWATQSEIIRGFAEFQTPDIIIREDDLQTDLKFIASQIGRNDAPEFNAETTSLTNQLSYIYDDEIESLAQSIYARDYLQFGFDTYAA